MNTSKKRERKPVLLHLKDVLSGVRKADSKNMLEVLSEELATCGFQNIVLKCGEKTARVVSLNLLQTEKTLEASLQGKECSIEALPHFEDHDIVFLDFAQIPAILECPPESLKMYSSPSRWVMIPFLDFIIFMGSDEIGEESAALSEFRDALILMPANRAMNSPSHGKDSFKELNELIIQSLHEPVMMEDAHGIITFVNRQFEELLERKKEEILGHHWREFTAPEFVSKAEEETAKRPHGISGQYEAAFMTRGGRKVAVMVGATPLFEKGQYTGVISVFIDLTVVKEKEKEIQQKNEDLQLLTKINHALNKGEPLRTILNMAAQELQRIFRADAVVIMSLSENGKEMSSESFAVSEYLNKVFQKITDEKIENISFTIEESSFLETIIKKREPFAVESSQLKIFRSNLSNEVLSKVREHIKLKSIMTVPLVAGNEVIGAVLVASQKEMTQDALNRLRALPKHLALALHHARLDENFKKTSRELQAHLSEQVLLRELLEKLYIVQDCREVAPIVAEGLKRLGHTYFAVAMKEPGTMYVNLLHVEPETILKKVAGIVKKAKGKHSLERIPLPEDLYIRKTEQKRKAALVTDNILLHKEKNIVRMPLKSFFQAWVGSELAEKVVSAMELQSCICIPFQVEKETTGAIVVGSEGILTHHDFVVLETLGQIIGEALEKLKYSEALERKSKDLEFSNRQLGLLQEITNALNSTMDLEEILKLLVRGISSVFGYSAPSVYLLSDDRKYLLVKEFDIDSSLLNGITRLVGFSLDDYKIPLFEGSQLKETVDEGKPLITEDIPRFLKNYTEKESLRRLAGALYRLGNVNWVAAIPLMAGDEPVGMLAFGSKQKIEERDIAGLSGFLDQAVLAVHRARLYQQLTEANQMKSEFIDIASHELRTPLTSIKLYLEMIKMGRYGPLSQELDEKIGLLQASAERLQEIIDKTLVSSRIIKERLELRKERISLAELIKDVVAQFRPIWEKKGQRIDIQGPYGLPLVEADRGAMWKVVTALIDNAIKYSPEQSKITVKLYHRPQEVEVAIMDEGIGIKQEYQKKIFEEFFIVPAETEYARMDGRTGLGLFIAKGIVEEHGGRIWVESVYGLGSTFHFTLPLGKSSDQN